MAVRSLSRIRHRHDHLVGVLFAEETDPWSAKLLTDNGSAPGAERKPLRLSPTLIVASDSMSRQRLTHIVNAVDSQADVTAVPSFPEACEALTCVSFSIAVVDVEVPDGLELVSRMRRHCGHMPILVISSFGRDDAVLAALHAGASGYVLKERDDIELILSLKSIQRGGTPIDPVAVRWILSLLPRPIGQAGTCKADGVRLSARELEVLQLLARGCSNRDIAGLISLSRLTVEGYIKSVYRKLGVGSRTAAVFEAQRLGLLP